MTDQNSISLDFRNLKILPDSLDWEHQPPNWTLSEQGLEIHTQGKTDLWQRTHYGIQTDNGHFLKTALKVPKFTLTTRVSYQGKHEFDQAGLMVRISPDNWIKTSVEHQPGRADKLGAVVTNLGYSDWSCQGFDNPGNQIILRIRAERPDFLIEYSLPETPEEWNLIRIAHLHEDVPVAPIQAGIYCCSPMDKGFKTVFSSLEISPKDNTQS